MSSTRTDFWHDADAPTPNSIKPGASALVVDNGGRMNALERMRLSSILPCLPDNDWLDDQIRQRQRLPSLRECSLDDREVTSMGDMR